MRPSENEQLGPSTTLPQLETMSEEEAVNTFVLDNSLYILEAVWTNLSMLGLLTYPKCSLQKTNLYALEDEHEFYHGMTLAQGADLLLTEPSYNIRGLQDEKTSNHLILRSTDMKAKEMLFGEVFSQCTQSHVLCCTLQFHPWYKVLSNEFLEKQDWAQLGAGSDAERWQNNRAVFEVESTPLHYMSSAGM